jgi:RimJ/RimL family protein N-acetyltransferase
MIEIDLPGIFYTHKDAETLKYTWIPNLQTPEEILQWILDEEKKSNSNYPIFSIINKADAAFLGLCGLRIRADLGDKIDLVYRIHPQNRLKGIATEAAKHMIGFGFNQLQLTEIFAQVHCKNVLSLRIMEKLNFDLVEETNPWLLFKLVPAIAQ